MTIIISGFGKMGTLLESRAMEKGWTVAAVIDPFYPQKVSGGGALVYRSLNDLPFDTRGMTGLDFSRPDAACANIRAFAEKRVPLVVGTTGWHDNLEEMRRAVLERESSLLYASNFSLGVNLFYKVAEYAAALIDRYAEYDIAGYEFHHNKKADSPSGTAKTLVEKVLRSAPRKRRAVYETLDRPPAPDELHFASLRSGAMPGTHALIFDSLADTIELTHTARSREGLVSGALVAAQWLAEQAAAGKNGVWTFDDVLG